jgi:hypothetical protein
MLQELHDILYKYFLLWRQHSTSSSPTYMGLYRICTLLILCIKYESKFDTDVLYDTVGSVFAIHDLKQIRKLVTRPTTPKATPEEKCQMIDDRERVTALWVLWTETYKTCRANPRYLNITKIE